ncbi:Short-chain dehydrogenase/reductase pyiH like protein [Verticillium longisporum]|uniref:Short-chain dehydrogenase/reductase pyiH like protein n=1 Tax=Verticillium longisporum TaxID=100787 RepID=A0A0G4KQ70_VERLO|nr:Short-chain dehydrogenase/reductase pyiH like protein [Verticillium longisporum]KAG7136051.1 Short-chain dehydrogenase/reductase pyiH like protein [Verticillium longisporum]CRK11595.1 hypothetical protein BN1723_009409 [Verticillium longisporum]
MTGSWDFLANAPILRGGVALVTGGNSGIGYDTISLLALRGAKVYMASRTKSKARQAMSEMYDRHPEIKPGQLAWVSLDLSDLKTVVAAADHVKANETRLDIIINNACGTTGLDRPASGWEPNLAVNYIGHFALNNLLLPLLKSTARLPDADVRIVVVSSNVQSDFIPASYVPNFTGPDALESPMPYYPWAHRWLFPIFIRIDMFAYAVSKLATALYARDLQRRLDEAYGDHSSASSSPILVTAVTPGMIRTPAMASVFQPWLTGLMQRLAVTPVEGARGSLFAATAADVRSRPEVFAGRFMLPVGRVAPLQRGASTDPTIGDGLWENTERGVNAYL